MHATRPIRTLTVLLTAALCLPALRTAAQTVTLPTCGVTASTAAYVRETDTLLLTVERLLELGVENSLRLRADRLHEEASGDRSRTARTERLPEMTVGLKGGFVGQPVVFEHGLSDATYPDAPDWSQNYAIDIVQPLYEGGRIRGGIRRAEIEERIARLGTQADCAEVKLELLRQYMDLFGLWKECNVLRRNIEESERRLRDIRQMKAEGLITNNDVLRSQMRLTDDRLSLREAIDNARIASQRLDIWMGIDEGTIILPDTTLLHLAVEPTPYEAYVDAACENDPSLRVLRAQTDLARNEVRLARAAYYPTVSLYAGNALARPIARTLQDLYNNNWNIGLSISYPLSALYRNRHKVREQQRCVELGRNAEEQRLQQVRMTVRTAFLRHEEAIERVRALELSVRQAEENYRIMQNRYLEQLAILTDLLDADRLRLESQLRLTTARTEVIYTYYELQKVCGRL
ncbi:TolC family protein [uncultured Alistipes sp.]|uniref:TolC family protein n=1 Tax=uncultured Alistipes sp. TaxID=538949 RepID=UPI002628916D|nr:TolC family protein [uncultured Alistipes sp.]